MKRVYAFEMESHIVKIGISKDVARRMQQVAYRQKEKIINLHFTELMPRAVAAKIECACHETFADRRLFGEFFDISFAEACAELDSYADEIEMANTEESCEKIKATMPVAEAFKRFRSTKGLIQKDVAAVLGMKQSSYAQYEQREKPVTPSADAIIKLANAYNISSDYLLGLTDDPRPVDEILAAQKAQEPPSPPSDIEKQLADLSARLSALESARIAQS